MAPSRSLEGPRGVDAIGAKRSLFQDESDISEGETEPTLTINEEYAKRFEHNKKREERHRLEEKYKSKKKANGGAEDGGSGSGSEDSSSDETEDEDGFLISEELDAEISSTLQAIKNRDPRIYDKDAVFYRSFDAKGGSAAPKANKKDRPMTLKDYHREQYMRGEVGEQDADEDGDQPRRTYVQEQDQLKKSILSEINAAVEGREAEDDDDDAFVKPKADGETPGNGVHPFRAATLKVTDLDVANADKNPDEFLNKFMASRAWAQHEGHEWAAFDSDEGDGGNDLAEEFETAYNMRFEDPEKSNEVLKSYSRVLATTRSVRQDDATGRKKRRMLEKERKEEEKRERQEERARLRRLKVEEAAEKLEKIKQAAGLSGRQLKDEKAWLALLDGAWDNDKWEEDMQRKFGEEYYAEQDHFSQGEEVENDEDEKVTAGRKRKGPKKPKWDDDVEIKDIVPDFDAGDQADIALTDSEDDGQQVAQAEKLPDKQEAEDDSEDEVEADRPSKKRKSGKDHRKERAEAKRQARRELSRIERLVDVKMTLDDHPRLVDSAGSSAVVDADGRAKKTATTAAAAAGPRFRYRETSPVTFGMTARDILLAPSDAALNEFAGLKRLATFRDPDRKRKDRKRLGKKARLREWRRETFGRVYERTGPTFGFGEEEEEGAGQGAGGGGSPGGSRGAGRRWEGDARRAWPAQGPSRGSGDAAIAATSEKSSKGKKRKRKNKKEGTSGL